MCKTVEHPITQREHKHSFVMTESIHHRSGGHILMATAIPKRLEELKPPVLVCNGYGSGIGAMGRLATILAEEEGRTVITYDEQRSRSAWPDPLGFRSDTILSVMDRFDDQTDGYFTAPTLIGWSTGGPAAIGVAEKLQAEGATERLGAVIPTASAGLGPQASELELTARAGLEVGRGLRSPRMIRALGWRAAQCCLGNLCRDVILSTREVGALSRLDMSERLAEVQASGVPLSIIAMQRDLIFPLDKMSLAVEQAGLSDNLRVIDGTHINLAWRRSVINQVVEIIDQTEAERSGRTAA